MLLGKKEKKILIVEDDLCAGRILFHMIRNVTPDVKIDWYLSAEEALAKINHLENLSGTVYDFVIADINLAGKNTGLDLWKICQKRNFNSKFLFISGMTKENFFKSLQTENTGKIHITPPEYLQKPISIPEGTQIIANAIN